jgi:hypothetical protein
MPEIGNPAAIRETVTQSYNGTFTFSCGNSLYGANDVLGPGAGGPAAIQFTNIGPKGADVMIDSAWLRIDAAALQSGEGAYRLALFNVTPPSNCVDNDAFTLPAGDRDAFLGFVNLGTPADEGDTIWCEVNGIWKKVTMLGSSLFGYLLTIPSYTPTARTFKVGLKTLLV